mmetsp:Transcript_32568/g.80985  ORF Transcript_32568/g.80985 Transcript_32568/m.80985 type:complete len:121 (-) Transcript_32568:430-792(-)
MHPASSVIERNGSWQTAGAERSAHLIFGIGSAVVRTLQLHGCMVQHKSLPMYATLLGQVDGGPAEMVTLVERHRVLGPALDLAISREQPLVALKVVLDMIPNRTTWSVGLVRAYRGAYPG